MKVREDLYGLWKNELEALRPGAQFHPVRALMSRHSASQRQVERILDRLAAENLIERRPKSGIFKHPGQVKSHKRVLSLVPDWPSRQIARLIRQLEAAGGERQEFVLENDTFSLKALQRVGEGDFDALLIVPDSRQIALAELRLLSSLDIPVVFFFRHLEDMAFSSIAPDNASGGLLAADYLLRNGHRKLAILISEPPSMPLSFRVNCFCSLAEAHGASVTVIDGNVHSYEPGSRMGYEALKAHLQACGCDFTGLFCVGDESGLPALAALDDFDLRIPDDVSVIVHDGWSEWGEWFRPAPATLKVDVDAMAARAVEGLKRIWRQEESDFHYLIKPRLIPGASVRNIVAVQH